MAELTEIKPGTQVRVEVVAEPTNQAARKTLARLLSKDLDAYEDDKRQRRIRQRGYNPQPRGGRLYGGHLVKQHVRQGTLGEKGEIRATVDVLRDLGSVQRFVRVEPV